MEVVKLNEQVVNESLVQYLETLLTEAKEGKLQSFSGCGIYQNGNSVTINSLHGFVDIFRMIGLICHLQFILTADAE